MFLSNFDLHSPYFGDFNLGPYTLNSKVSLNLSLLQEDQDHAEKLVDIDNFLAEMFATLSLSAFRSNSMLAVSLSAPSWSFTKWHESSNGQVFGTNMVLTCDGFRNSLHTDRDETNYSLGFWGIVDKNTGRLITSQERQSLLQRAQQPESHCNALGAKFHIGNITVHLDSADVVMMVFNTQILHQTTHPDLQSGGDCFGGNLTRCATSSQISKTSALALGKIANCRGDMGDEEWLEVRKYFGKNYCDEVDQKKIKVV